MKDKTIDKKNITCYSAIMDRIRPDQCRAARALLGWSAAELAQASGVGVATIRRFELGETDMRFENHHAIIGTLRNAGITLVDEGEGHGAGVRWISAGGAEVAGTG